MSSTVTHINSARRAQDDERTRRDRLRELGIYLPPMLEEARKAQETHSYLVEGLLRTRSINLLVGDSGLGKTPLAMQIGISVAAGIPLFGLKTQQGRVLYGDAESDLAGFTETLNAISRYLGLPKPPVDFHVWSPTWSDAELESSWDAELMERVKVVRPTLVIADPLRMFWRFAEAKATDAASAITGLRELTKSTGTSWLISHHRRKVNRNLPSVDLVEDPHAWFQEASGALALVNQSDTRLGVEPGTGEVDLIVGGFRRGTGKISPLNLARATNGDGSPVGYLLLVGIDLLESERRAIFDKLRATFRFKDVKAALGGTSDSNAQKLIERFSALGLIRKEGTAYGKLVFLHH